MTNQLQGVSAEMSNKILNYVNAKAKTPEERQAMINDMLPEAVAYEKKQQRKAGRETYKSQLREKIAQETKTEPSNQLKIWLRTANLADMVRDYAEKNGGNTQWLDDDKELLNRFLAKNPNQAKSVQRYMNGEISNVELWKRLWFITYDDTTWEQAGISEEKEEWPWFWAQVGQAGKDIVWGVYDSVTGIGKLAGKGLGNAVARTAKKFWADEQKVDELNQSWKDSLDGKNNLWLGTDVGQDKDALTYKATNAVADLAQVAAPGGIVRAGAKGLQLANTSTKVGEVLAKAFPKVANVISKSEKGADFVVGLLNKTGGKIDQLTQKLPILWKILKGGFEWASDTVLFNAVNGEGTDLKDAWLGAGIWGAFPVVWKMLWWLGGKAKNLIWKGASKLELNGNLNPAKLEAVQKQLIEEGATLPGKATPEEVGKWMLERGFKWSKGDLIAQLNTHAQKSKAMVDELLWLSSSTHKVKEVNQALEMLAKDYSTTPWLTKKADEILGLMKDEYTLSEMNQVKRYMDEAYNMFKQNGWEVAGLKAEGLRTIRKEIKTTIENVAEQEGLGNIRMLNNETQVARGLAEGIAKKEEAGILRQVTSPFSSIRNGAILGGIGGGMDPRDSFPERLLKIAWGAVVGGLIGSTKAKTTLANMLKKLWGVERKELEQWVATEGKSQLSQTSQSALTKIANEIKATNLKGTENELYDKSIINNTVINWGTQKSQVIKIPEINTRALDARASFGKKEINYLIKWMGTTQNKRVIVSDVSNDVLEKLKSAGVNEQPKINVINSNELQHAIKRHWIASKTLSSNEVPLTKADFKHIPEIIKNPDSIHISPKPNRRWNTVVIYKKRIWNLFYYLEQVSKKEWILETQTMFKNI